MEAQSERIKNSDMKDKDLLLPSKPRLVVDNTGGPEKPKNWLKDLEVGIVFVCKGRDKNPMCMEFHVINQRDKLTKLMSNLNEKDIYSWVDHELFTEAMELVDILGKDPEDDQ